MGNSSDYKEFTIFDKNNNQMGKVRLPLDRPKPKGFLGHFDISGSKMMGITSLTLGGLMIYKKVKEIKNDVVRKNLIDDLRRTDPVLSEIPEEQLLEWYATIVHFAPKFSLDKSAVREVLQGFARFGRVDVNTLKMIADTEKATQQAADYTKSWGSVLTDIAKTVSIGG